MDRKHLLWWVFHYLERNHPDVLDELLAMEGEFGGEATHTVAEAMQERYEAFRKAKGGVDD